MAKTKKPPSHKSKASQVASKERRSDLAKDIARMAKTANQRLRELEKRNLTKSSNAYRYVERLSYDKDSATATDSKGRFKFSTSQRGKSYAQMQHEKAELERFLYEAKTSTVKGTIALYEKGYATYVSKAEERNKMLMSSGSAPIPILSRDDYGDMWRMRNMKKLANMYGSKEAIKMVSEQKEDGLSMEEIDNFLDEVPKDTTIMDFEERLEDYKFHQSDEVGFSPF